MRFSERPLSRQLLRYWLRLRYGAELGHAQDWTPHLRLTLPEGNRRGSVYYRDSELAQLLLFHDFQAMTSPALVLVGSGPSLRDQNLARLSDRSLIYLNGAVSRIVPRAQYPAMVAIEDERFVWRHFDMLRDHLDDGTGLMLSVAALRAIAENDAEWLRRRPIFLIENLFKPYNAPRRTIDSPELHGIVVARGDKGFSLEPQAGVVPAGTIAFSALQWAMARQPSVIGFAGIDLSNANQPRFYETRGRVAKSGIFDGQHEILAHFALAADWLQDQGIPLECYSGVSALQSIGIPYQPILDEPIRQRVA